MTNQLNRLKRRLASKADQSIDDDFGPYAPTEPIGGMVEVVVDPLPWIREVSHFEDWINWEYAKRKAEQFVRLSGGEIERIEPHPHKTGPYKITVYWLRPNPGSASASKNELAKSFEAAAAAAEISQRQA